MKPTKARWTFATLALASLGVAAALTAGSACSDDSTPGSCATDFDCARGTVCVNGACGVQTCANAGDCKSSQLCLEVNGSKVCTGAECGCLDCEACPDGKQCVEGSCVEPQQCQGICPGDPCVDDAGCDQATEKCHDGKCWPTEACFVPSDCGDGEVCKDHACVPCEGDECGAAADCTVDGCDAGFHCDEATKQCVEDTTGPTADPCAACTKDEDCGGPDNGWSCIPTGGAQVCLPPCATGDDCPAGWTCDTSQGGKCFPSGYKCQGCVMDGCADGQVCNTNDGSCVEGKSECDPCQYDWECGEHHACHKLGSLGRFCVPRCSGGAACPGSSQCVSDGDTGVMVCEPPQGLGCCFSTDPSECTPVCDAPTPVYDPISGNCVGCLQDTDCASGTCDQTTHTCGGTGSCQDPTPYFSPDAGKCVQCLDNSHCGGGECDTTTWTCAGDVCSTCVDPYPACALVGGEYYCVQCTQDADCTGGGTCNQSSYACEGGTVVTPGQGCETDADCDAGITDFDLYCAPGGYCVDKKGKCDDVTAYCLGGNKCVSMIEQLLGSAGGGTSGLPDLGGGSTLPGSCECVPDGIEGLSPTSTQCPPDARFCSPGLMSLVMSLLDPNAPTVNTCNAGLGQ